jgi:hypothetical protein
VIQRLTNLLLAPETLEENRIALHLEMRNLDCNLLSGPHVPGTEYSGHAAVRDYAFKLKIIQLLTRLF